MSKFKRTCSALLAIVMIFTTLSIAFTVIGSAAPTVERTAATVLNPHVTISVPGILESYGSDYYQRGSNIKPAGNVFISITTSSASDEVKDVAVACSDAGVSLGVRVKLGQDGYSWDVSGGTLKTAPNDDGSTLIKWTFTYQVNGKAFKSEAWSVVKPLYNNPGFSVYLTHNNTYASHATENYHIEWIQPLYGNAATATNSEVTQCYINTGAGTHFASTGPAASDYYWRKDRGSTGGDRSDTCPVEATGTLYVDVGQISDLSETGLQSMTRRHNLSDEDGNHFQYYRSTSVTSQTIDGQATNNYSVSQSGTVTLNGAQTAGDVFSGEPPAAGSTAIINAQIHFEGNVDKDFPLYASSHHYSYTNYIVTVQTYDKSALGVALANATAANYQESQFLNTVPSGIGSGFRTWDQYHTALQNAWYIYGREDVSNAQVTAATNALTAAMPKYNVSTGAWQSGMKYGPADYSRIDSIIETIPEVLDPDFYAKYSDNTYGKYYQYSYAALLIDALDDIEYDRPLDSRYQATVDQMRVNLSTAINTVNGKVKQVSVEFLGNQTDVRNVPSPITTSLIGTVQKPSTDPSKEYYRFNGWYYDEACTKAVTWPLYVNATSENFLADLNVKNDNAGVAYRLYAGWQLTGTTLSFDTQGGSEMAPVVGNNGASYAGPTEVPTKPGWKFVGWYLDATTQNPVDWSTFTFGYVSVVYAKWEKDTFSVTFNAMGGAFSNGSTVMTVTGEYGTPVAEPPTPTKSGNGFAGWYHDATYATIVDFNSFTIPSANTTIYAKWSSDIRNLTLQYNNGETPVVLTYTIGASVQAPSTPSRPGFTFKAWYYDSLLLRQASFPFNMGTDNVTLYAGWTPLKFTVTFSAGEGTMPASYNAADYVNLDCGSVLVPPPEPTREGYIFTGWTLNGEPYTLTTVPAQNIDLVASWDVEPNMVKFRLRTDAPADLTQGDVITATVSMQANHIVSTHAFVVYYDNRYLTPALNGQPVVDAINGPSAVSATPGAAYFTLSQNPGGNVTACGTANGRVLGGIAPATNFFPADWTVSNTELKAEYSHFEFVYFTVTDTRTGTRMMPDPEQDICSFQFIVREDADNTDGVTTYAQILMPDFFTRTPERTNGKIYAAPEVSTAFVQKKNYDNTTVSVLDGDQRFKISTVETCHINFVTNGGAALDSIDAKQGRTVALPTPDRGDYYNFLGWTLTNNSSDTAYVNADAFSVPTQSSLTLYAKWGGKPADYYVRHHKQNLTATGWLEAYDQEKFSAEVGTYVTAAAKSYDGFICMNEGDGGTVEGSTQNPLVIDLYYMRKTVNIELNANGGVFSNNQQSVTLSGLYGATVSNPYTNPTRTGYTFDGWEYKSAAYTLSTFPASDITLLAKWSPNTVVIRFFLNGSTTPTWTKSGKFGDPITAPSVTVQDGQIFTGWRNSSNVLFNYTTFPAADEDFFGSIEIDGYNLTLFVDGIQYGDPIGIRTGTTVTEDMINYTPQPGYTFTGWRVSNSVDAALAVFPMTLRANTSLYGFTSRQTYTIRTYIYVDGELEDGPSVKNLYYGQSFSLPIPEDYTDSGYGFRGWYTDPDLTQLYVKPATMPAQNIVLYGEYYELVGTIHFDANGATSGTAPADITSAMFSTVNLPGSNGLKKQYYKFDGWALSANASASNAITSYMIQDAEPVTVYAIWTVNFATLSFDLNGGIGTIPASMKAEVGTSVAASELPADTNFSRSGYIFLGWAAQRNATQPLSAYSVTATGNKTLFAVWAAATVELAVKGSATTVIDNTRHFIYGLAPGVTESDLNNTYLEVVGNGHLEYEYEAGIGTGTIVHLINDYTGQEDATYWIVIFGDLNGDGNINSTDTTEVRMMRARLKDATSFDNPYTFAADIVEDSNINSSDETFIRMAAARIATIDQATREVHRLDA
ncbi:MAG: InlB B-repeat-containing protein [Clostridia bacterium]|nr:InlB B-repeat-containing protein [Clostridia bacterium]